jgi:alkylation response protein AidB-like acyl-CoA dehydrogenase
MVNFDLTDEQQMLQELARDFANEEIKPYAAQWDKESVYPKEAIAKANELGLLTLKIPEKYGGGGMGSFEEVLVLEEFGFGDPGFATAAGSSMLASYPLITGGTEASIELPAAVANPGSPNPNSSRTNTSSNEPIPPPPYFSGIFRVSRPSSFALAIASLG